MELIDFGKRFVITIIMVYMILTMITYFFEPDNIYIMPSGATCTQKITGWGATMFEECSDNNIYNEPEYYKQVEVNEND